MGKKVTLTWVGEHVSPFVPGHPYEAELMHVGVGRIVVNVLGSGSGYLITDAFVIAVDGDQYTVTL